MILLALGANLTGPWGSPRETLERVIEALDAADIGLIRRSSWLRTRPFGVTAQPDFVNGVIAVAGHVPPDALLARCQRIERAAGRRAARRWGARACDIDILDWNGVVRPPPDRLVLPHPGIPERAFVLAPLCEIAPRWHHPVTGLTAVQMALRLRAREGGIVGTDRVAGAPGEPN